MLAHERKAGSAMRERILHTPSHNAVQALLDRLVKRAPDDDAAERDGRTSFGLPEFAEVDDLLQALRCVCEPVLVDDQPRLETPLEYGTLDLGEEHLGL